MGLRGKIWETIDVIDNEITIAVNGHIFAWFEIKQGVGQGCVLSGFLYCVCINDLLNSLECVDKN